MVDACAAKESSRAPPTAPGPGLTLWPGATPSAALLPLPTWKTLSSLPPSKKLDYNKWEVEWETVIKGKEGVFFGGKGGSFSFLQGKDMERESRE